MHPILRHDPAFEYALRRGPEGQVCLIAFLTTDCRWRMIFSDGTRGLKRRVGRHLLEPGEDHASGIVREAVLKGDFGAPGAARFAAMSADERYLIMLDFHGHPSDAFDAFVTEVGAASWLALLCEMPCATLQELDVLCGRSAVDEFFGAWPFMMSSLRNVSADKIAGLVEERHDAGRLAGLLVRFDFEHSELPRSAGRHVGGEDVLPSGPERDAAELAVRRLLTRLRGTGCSPLSHSFAPISFTGIMRFAAAVPPDWLPSDPDSFEGFVRVGAKLLALRKSVAGFLDLRKLAAPAKGRWTEFDDRMRDMSLPRFSWNLGDMTNAFRQQIVVPAFARLVRDGRAAGEASEDRIRIGIIYALTSVPSHYLIWRTCAHLLFDAMSAGSVRRANVAWHGAVSAIDSKIGTLSLSWAVPFESVSPSEGCHLVALSDSASLSAEGRTLRHCVGGSFRTCMAMACVIVSVRRRGQDGAMSSTSTVEFTGWKHGEAWHPKVVQHQGRGNRAADQADVQDVDAAMEMLTGMVAPERVPTSATPASRIDDISMSAGYDWNDQAAFSNAFGLWSGFLSRDIRSGGPDALLAAIARVCEPGEMEWLKRDAFNAMTAPEEPDPGAMVPEGSGPDASSPAAPRRGIWSSACRLLRELLDRATPAGSFRT